MHPVSSTYRKISVFEAKQHGNAVFARKLMLDYYPFGMLMPGRHYTTGSASLAYRYGMNGQEKDDEIYGTGNSYSAEFWQYDARIGRRWNQDPRPNASISNYATFTNNPVWFSDPLGDTVQITFRAGGFLGLRKNTVNYDNGTLTNRDGSAYTGKVSRFAQAVVSDLDKINSGVEGGAALAELIGSKNVTNIVRSFSGNGYDPKSPIQASLGMNPNLPAGQEINGSGGTISYNPWSRQGGLDTRGSNNRPAFVGLGHELGHSLSANRGMADYSSITSIIQRDEYFASDLENRIRAEHFLALRQYYTSVPLLENGKDYNGRILMKPKTINEIK